MSNEEPTPPPKQLPDMSQPPTMTRPVQSYGAVDTWIPTENKPALLSYYLGLFSIFPVFGLIMGFIAIRSGRTALKAVKETPGLPGATHARVGLGCGIVGFVFNLLFTGLILFAIVSVLLDKKKS